MIESTFAGIVVVSVAVVVAADVVQYMWQSQ